MAQRLLANSPNTRLVEVNARNSSLGSYAIRRRSISADSLADTPPALDEYQYIPSSITAIDHSPSPPEATDDTFTQRSVGFGTARVSDTSRRRSLNEWTNWTEKLSAAALDATRKKPVYLDRFAKALDAPPQRPSPTNVLIDVSSIRDQFLPLASDQTALEIDDTCWDCKPLRGSTYKRNVSFRANNIAFEGTFEYLPGEHRYVLDCPDFARCYRHIDGVDEGSIVDFLNHTQAYVVIPETPNVIYSDGNFFDPQLGLGPTFDPAGLGLHSILVHHSDLRHCISEKGASGSATRKGWATDSVFNWIDNHVDDILPGAQLAICDDGNHETCEFLLAGSANGTDSVVMVHAKANNPGSFVSAKSIQEVCSQAQKQLSVISAIGTSAPPQLSVWSGEWTGPSGEGVVGKRIRRQQGAWKGLDASNIWERLHGILRRPATNRQVAIVMGATLDRSRLYAQARKSKPPAPAVHCIRLLRTTLTAASSVNARLKVFCG